MNSLSFLVSERAASLSPILQKHCFSRENSQLVLFEGISINPHVSSSEEEEKREPSAAELESFGQMPIKFTER